jgi:hypothetical protein
LKPGHCSRTVSTSTRSRVLQASIRDIRHLAHTQTLRLHMMTPIGRSRCPVVTELAAEPLPPGPRPVNIPASTGITQHRSRVPRTTHGHRPSQGIRAQRTNRSTGSSPCALAARRPSGQERPGTFHRYGPNSPLSAARTAPCSPNPVSTPHLYFQWPARTSSAHTGDGTGPVGHGRPRCQSLAVPSVPTIRLISTRRMIDSFGWTISSIVVKI